jgi:RNA polymerase sigma-54 factor
VSRAVKEKYADSPRGLVCLRDLFTRQVGNPGADERSNVQIMERIRQLVENENPQKPLKDAQIVNLLKSEGINIVRRTVAKYRQNLNIPSYNQRRKYS